jgi:hypothetical protein
MPQQQKLEQGRMVLLSIVMILLKGYAMEGYLALIHPYQP